MPKEQQTKDVAEMVAAMASRYEAIEDLNPDSVRAREPSTGAEVVLKLVPAQRATELSKVTSVLNEIRAAANLDVLGCEMLCSGGAVFISRYDGSSTLRERMEEADPVDEPSAIRWMHQVCHVMTLVAHKGIVHRNLKPTNVTISDSMEAMITGFGLASFAGRPFEGPVGTPAYAAPEQFTGKFPIDERSDIFAFGATFYHALTGHQPRDATMPVLSPPKVDQDKLRPARLSETTVRLLERCLAENPYDRFQSFAQLKTFLERPDDFKSRLGPAPPKLDRYPVLSELGRGGMGVVYKAYDWQSNRKVAIKFIRAANKFDAKQLARFRVEAHAIACLRHENIVPVLNIDVFDGCPFLVLEYIQGGNLRDRMRQGRPDPAWSARTLRAIAGGVAHLHGCSIIHRDLKPENVLITTDGVPKITDFGLAKFTVTGEQRQRLFDASIMPDIGASLFRLPEAPAVIRQLNLEDIEDQIAETVSLSFGLADRDPEATATFEVVRDFVTTVAQQRARIKPGETAPPEGDPTMRGEILGTPIYMAPEQTLAQEVGRHTDIYALGAMLYELLSGRPPHTPTTLEELFDQIRNCPPPPLDKDVPVQLRRICMKCLEKSPERRFRSARELVGELAEFLASPEAATHEADRERRWWQLWRS